MASTVLDICIFLETKNTVSVKSDDIISLRKTGFSKQVKWDLCYGTHDEETRSKDNKF